MFYQIVWCQSFIFPFQTTSIRYTFEKRDEITDILISVPKTTDLFETGWTNILIHRQKQSNPYAYARTVDQRLYSHTFSANGKLEQTAFTSLIFTICLHSGLYSFFWKQLRMFLFSSMSIDPTYYEYPVSSGNFATLADKLVIEVNDLYITPSPHIHNSHLYIFLQRNVTQKCKLE